MQLLISLVWATFTLYASALGDSLIYFPTEEASGSSPRESSISPNTARLLLASRLGLSQYHELGDVDERTLDTLSQFTSGKIFAQSEPQRKLLLIIDGAEAQKDLLESSQQDFTSVSITDTRSGPTTNKLIKDLLRPSGHPNLHEANLDIQYINSRQDLSALIAHATIILLPAPHTTNAHTPSLFSSLLQQNIKQHPLSRRNAEDPDAETPLSPLEDSSSSSSTAAAPTSSSTAPPSPKKKGPQPLCHPTLPLLLSATQNCSDHGHPVFRTGGEGKADCYSCRCEATVLRPSEGGGGEKTIHWGGGELR
ncbi:MAG: hypothetical protein OHK93_007493 [Ramalina farinacea]|uniref:Uncharacterized protein n=1 Tax=Ramalina farinacea TaxID=258253 RepID=A0AA43TUF1_9LECA|nr:hypothetical protein [Ramalina farinacea]